MKSKAKNRFLTALPYLPDEPEFFEEFRTLLSSQLYTNRGPFVVRFENDLKRYLSVPKLEVVTCSNATLGLELALRAFGLRGKVIVSPFTFVATVHSIVQAGMEPVFADIDPKTLCLSPQSVEDQLTREVSAILPVHAYGNVCDTHALDAFRAQGKKVIYDSAHAFGVRTPEGMVGGFGDAEVFSFHSTKLIHSFEGGAVTSHDPDFAKKVNLMTNFGILNETEVDLIGTNAKMSEVHALMGIYCLKKIHELLIARRKVRDQYRKLLSEFSEIELLPPQQGVETNAQYFPIFLESQKVRDGLYDSMRARSMMVRKYFFPPIHQLKPYRGIKHAPLPVSERISRKVLCLPMNAYLTSADVNEVAETIGDYFSAGARKLAA